jgi:DNA-binding NtrC family response regulator
MKHGKPPLFLVDDDETALALYRTVLEYHGERNLVLFRDGGEVSAHLARTGCSLLLLDLHMPGVSGRQVLEDIRREHPQVPVVVVTADDAVETAVECMKLGAFDYLTKPVEKNRLWAVVRHALELTELQQEVGRISSRFMSDRLGHPEAFENIVTNSDSMKAIFRYVEAIAASPRPVLLTGESGTGKELVARAIHALSEREGSFVAVNAASLDDTMFSDTLFGHVRGAYTGAEGERRGLVEAASGGTLFLDEIGDLQSGSQVRLLRLLQEEEYYPLGCDQIRKASARIIAATNADLQQRQAQGAFRKDLYFRLMAHHIEIPPLRERFEDLPLLVERFLEQAAEALDRKKPSVPKELYALLETHGFPGNVRELQSMIFDAVGRQRGNVLPLAMFKEYMEKLRGERGAPRTVSSSGQPHISYTGVFPTLRETEEFFVREALRRSKGNQSLAAQLLGINQSTLSRRLKAERRAEAEQG